MADFSQKQIHNPFPKQKNKLQTRSRREFD